LALQKCGKVEEALAVLTFKYPAIRVFRNAFPDPRCSARMRP
jgi:hypothetical protein